MHTLVMGLNTEVVRERLTTYRARARVVLVHGHLVRGHEPAVLKHAVDPVVAVAVRVALVQVIRVLVVVIQIQVVIRIVVQVLVIF
jgi:hypothetical protein